MLPQDIEVQLAGGDGEVGGEEVRDRRGREGDGNVEEPAEQGCGPDCGDDRDGGYARRSCRLFGEMGGRVVCSIVASVDRRWGYILLGELTADHAPHRRVEREEECPALCHRL